MMQRMSQPLRLGIIGCGNISSLYADAAQYFPVLDFRACSDLEPSRAQAFAQRYGLEAMDSADLLAHPDIDAVVNLTVPQAHAEVSRAALLAGKHVYSEKPLATTLADGQELLELAAQQQRRLACAPSTFLGAAVQTARYAIDQGMIGQPVAANAVMLSHGMEHWHPNPAFFYQAGAGPLMDMGPYYLAALLNLLGPMQRVTASARISFPERSGKQGSFPVTTPTHIAAVLDCVAGPVVSLVTSFDVWHSNIPKFEIYGSEGSLSIPAPNMFYGPVLLRSAQADDWQELPLVHSHDSLERSWGIALADFAYAIAHDRPHRASAALGLHALEIMQAILTASSQQQHVLLESRCERPAALVAGQDVLA